MASHVQTIGTGGVSGGTSFTITVPAGGVAAGDSILIWVCTSDVTSGHVSVTDAAGNTYVIDRDDLSGGSGATVSRLVLARCHGALALTSGQLITVHLSTSATAAGVADEYAGLSGAPVNSASAGAITTALSSGNVTTTTANLALIGGLGWTGNVTVSAYEASWTGGSTGSAGSGGAERQVSTEWRFVSATGTYAATGTLSGAESNAATIVTYATTIPLALAGQTALPVSTSSLPNIIVSLAASLSAVLSSRSQLAVLFPLVGGSTSLPVSTQSLARSALALAGGTSLPLSTQGVLSEIQLLPHAGSTTLGVTSAAGPLTIGLPMRSVATLSFSTRATLGEAVTLTGRTALGLSTHATLVSVVPLLGGTQLPLGTSARWSMVNVLGGLAALPVSTQSGVTMVSALASRPQLPLTTQSVLAYTVLPIPLPNPTEELFTVRVRDPHSYQVLLELDSYDSFTYTRRWQASGSFQIKIGNEIPNRALCTPIGTVYEFLRNGLQEFVGAVDVQDVTLDSTGEEGFVWTLSGSDMAQSLANYRAGHGQNKPYTISESAAQALQFILNDSAGPAAPGMKHQAWLALGSAYAPGPNGQIIVPAQSLGAAVTLTVYYNPLLALLRDICGAGAVGFRFRLADDGKVYFDVYVGADRTEGTGSGFVPAIFNVDRDTLTKFHYTLNAAQSANAVVSVGPGTVNERTVILAQDTASQALIGYRETVIDSRNAVNPDTGNSTTNTPAIQQTQAAAVLAKKSLVQTIVFSPMDATTLLYRVNWDLGDKVTVRNDEAGLLANVQISEIKVTFNTGASAEIDVTAGVPQPTALDILNPQPVVQPLLESGTYTPPLEAPITFINNAPVNPIGGSIALPSVGQVAVSASAGSVGAISGAAAAGAVGAISGSLAAPSIGASTGDPDAAKLADVQALATAVQNAVNAMTGMASHADVQTQLAGLAGAINALSGMARQSDVSTALANIATAVNGLHGAASQTDVTALITAIQGGFGSILAAAPHTTDIQAALTSLYTQLGVVPPVLKAAQITT